MHFKLLFCIVFLQLLRYGDAGSEEQPDLDVKPGRIKVPRYKKEKDAIVDLASGRRKIAAIRTSVAKWVNQPIRHSRLCSTQGVMKLRRPWWSKVLSVYLRFDKPRGYTFNIGNSIYNNAWGGDGNSYKWNAEIHNYDNHLFGWASEYDNNRLLFVYKYKWRENWLLIRIYAYGVYITNFQGWSVWHSSAKFFKMSGSNFVYIGINRVVKYAYASPTPSRYTGSGLCHVRALWS